jgi:hypothetical protein
VQPGRVEEYLSGALRALTTLCEFGNWYNIRV